MKLPIRLTITTSFVLFTAATVALITFINFNESRQGILETAQELIARSAETADQNIESLVGRARIISESVASLPVSVLDWNKPTEIQEFLSAGLRNVPELYGVFVGFPNGAFVQAINFIAPDGTRRVVDGIPSEAAIGWRVIRPDDSKNQRVQIWRFFDQNGAEVVTAKTRTPVPATYDPRTRSWFKAAQTRGQTNLSKVYVFSSLQQPGVTISTPVQNLKYATVGVDLPLADLANLTKRLSPGADGVVAIMDADGDMVAHPEPEKILVKSADGGKSTVVSISEIDDLRLQVAFKTAQSTKDRHFSFSADGKDYIANFRAIGGNDSADWHIVSIAAVDDFTAKLVSGLERSTILAISAMVIAVFGVTVLAGWIAAPIIRLRDHADRITNMDLTPLAEMATPFQEIQSLQRAVERMRTALDTFLRYVPRDLVYNLVRTGQAARIGGSNREVTLLFTDIEGFTTISESLTPEQILSQTSTYFEQMSFAIQASMGTIDKFIGDAIMAMWNAPTDDEFHVDNACRGTLAALCISRDLDTDLVSKGKPPMRTRFGLHTDVVLVGNMGAPDRMQYTCLGSGVNLAARIEGMNKMFGTQVLASESVRRKASSDFLFRRVDIVEAKGTSIPVTVYELMGERGAASVLQVGNEEINRASRYEQAFDMYLHRDFKYAIQILEDLQDEAPEDGVIAALLNKCRDLIAAPLPGDWNGVTALSQK